MAEDVAWLGRPSGAWGTYLLLFPGFRPLSAGAECGLHPGLFSRHPSGMLMAAWLAKWLRVLTQTLKPY